MIKPGTVVTLITGGPKMTVSRQRSSPAAEPVSWECLWFEGTTLHSGSFTTDSLIEVE